MRGLLYRSEGKWFVINTQATLNGPLIQSIPLLPSDVKQINDWYNIFDNIEGRMYSDPKVDFKIEKDCPFNFTSRCTMDRCDCDQYAKLIQK